MTIEHEATEPSPVEDEAFHLRRAIESRTTIGIAIGIVMTRLEVDADAAFEFLRTRSQSENRKLYDLASEIRATRRIQGP